MMYLMQARIEEFVHKVGVTWPTWPTWPTWLTWLIWDYLWTS